MSWRTQSQYTLAGSATRAVGITGLCTLTLIAWPLTLPAVVGVVGSPASVVDPRLS